LLLLGVVLLFLFALLRGVFVDLGVNSFAPFATAAEFVNSVGAVFSLQAKANSTISSTSFGSLIQSTSIRLYAKAGCAAQGDRTMSAMK
jgi:hypothetical protein